MPCTFMPGAHFMRYAVFYVRHRTEDRRNEADNFFPIPIAAAGQESLESRRRQEQFASREPIARRWREEEEIHEIFSGM